LLDRTASALLATETLSEPEIEALKRQIEPAADRLPAGSQRPTAIVAAS
jgi:hypothetical protein